MSKVDENLKSILKKVNQLNNIEFNNKAMYIFELKKWLYNLVDKNIKIKRNKQSERRSRTRQSVYCLDFGVNVGTEFNYFHFCAVVKEFDNTAIVVPLSTEKEKDSEFKSAANLIFPIGVIEDMPKDKKPVYALVNQIKTVSKQRLTDYYVKEEGKYYPMMLNEFQMQTILDAIKTSIGEQEVKQKKKVTETV